jgi:uncharacterized protein involved in outer membrane biogenesis
MLKKVISTMRAPRAKKIMGGLFILWAVFTLVGFLVLPPVLKSVLIKELSRNLNREVMINQIRINPYAFSATVRGLTVKERNGAGTFLSCDEIFLNLRSTSVLRRALILEEIRLTKPYIRISRNEDLTYNFSDLLEQKEPASPKKANSRPPGFSLNNITIKEGSADFLDQPTRTTHTVRDLKIGIPFLSNIASYVQRFVRPHFSAKIDDALYTINGRAKPFADSLETSIDVDIKDLDIRHYLAYVPVKMNFKVVSAYLDAATKISFIETKEEMPSLTVTGTLSLKNVAVNDAQDKPFFKLSQLDVSIAPSEPLSQIVHLSRVSIQSPEWDIRRDEKGVLNTQFLLYEKGKERVEARKEGKASPFSLDIDAMNLSGGKVSFSDLSENKHFKTVFDPIDLKIDHFSNGKDKKTGYALTLKTEANEGIKNEGEFSVEPLWSEGTLEVSSVPLKKYSPYYKDSVLLDVVDGRLDLAARYRYAAGGKEPEINLSGVSLMLKRLLLRKAGENQDFIKIPNFTVTETDVDVTKRELKIGNVSTEKGELFVKRLSNGDVNIFNLTPTAPAPKESPAPAQPKSKTEEKAIEPSKPWLVSLRQVLLDRYAVRVEDRTTPDPVTLTIQDLRLRGENISTAKNSKGKLAASLLLNRKGTVSATGTIGVEPFSANLRVGLKGVEVVPLQPYFSDKVKMTVTGGAISTDGNLSVVSSEKTPTKVTYKGEVSLTNFASIDRLSGEDLVKFESLSLSDLSFGLTPLSIAIKGVSLTDYYALVVVSPEGNINLREVLATEEPKAESAPIAPRQLTAKTVQEEKEPTAAIKIDQITLQGGRIDFLDRSVKPQFSTKLSEMGGRVSGLSAQENTAADVELRAKLNDYAPLEITGKISPLTRDLFVDLTARVKDLDLSPATPYSGKYAGYAIEKGKFSMDVKYSIVNRKLDSQNTIFIDQFTFGEKVESPDATKLPVRLAVALLKDRKGEIKLDLPVTGSLDDPKFSVWKIILRIVVNLIAKAAVSPFALLGAAFGGGEELSYLEFDYGHSAIAEPGAKKLDTVVKALHDRPSLKLDIEGHADVEKDRDALKQVFFERKLKAQKLKEMVKKGEAAVPIDDVRIESTEGEKYLKMAYKEEKFPKPKNLIGMAKDIPAPEMEKLILTNTEVKEEDLRTLASQRAMKVKEAIVKSGQVEPERVFIVEPQSLAPQKKEKVNESRVDFKLK